jgi:hypothetical protein
MHRGDEPVAATQLVNPGRIVGQKAADSCALGAGEMVLGKECYDIIDSSNGVQHRKPSEVARLGGHMLRRENLCQITLLRCCILRR